ncbi:hypothetical protein [Paralysiella testudinis]|uniref:Uncharacterized protein n=1 Tax=Paralysiella testudinis TaxID=2809020 RepID=A0A892ZDY5_9NEIS|nr:hypothetical protein [Paralysiella testudinis]QRQ80840.1 hypothetical protein JQU52_08755 [Paralysiella testudinis]
MNIKSIITIAISTIALSACDPGISEQLEVSKFSERHWLTDQLREGVSIVNKGDELQVERIIFNKGNCNFPSHVHETGKLFYGIEIKIFPEYTQRGCDKVYQVEIITTDGSATYNW